MLTMRSPSTRGVRTGRREGKWNVTATTRRVFRRVKRTRCSPTASHQIECRLIPDGLSSLCHHTRVIFHMPVTSAVIPANHSFVTRQSPGRAGRFSCNRGSGRCVRRKGSLRRLAPQVRRITRRRVIAAGERWMNHGHPVRPRSEDTAERRGVLVGDEGAARKARQPAPLLEVVGGGEGFKKIRQRFFERL